MSDAKRDEAVCNEPAHYMKLRAAERLADEAARLITMRVLDARSGLADALLDYRNPPRSERSDRLVELEQQLTAATAAREQAEAACGELRQEALRVIGLLEDVGNKTEWTDGDETDRVYAWYELEPLAKLAENSQLGKSTADELRRLRAIEAAARELRQSGVVCIGHPIDQAEKDYTAAMNKLDALLNEAQPARAERSDNASRSET